MPNPVIVDLRTRSSGQVITREEADYEAARKVYNGMIDRHPHVIVRAAAFSGGWLRQLHGRGQPEPYSR